MEVQVAELLRFRLPPWHNRHAIISAFSKERASQQAILPRVCEPAIVQGNQ